MKYLSTGNIIFVGAIRPNNKVGLLKLLFPDSSKTRKMPKMSVMPKISLKWASKKNTTLGNQPVLMMLQMKPDLPDSKWRCKMERRRGRWQGKKMQE